MARKRASLLASAAIKHALQENLEVHSQSEPLGCLPHRLADRMSRLSIHRDSGKSEKLSVIG